MAQLTPDVTTNILSMALEAARIENERLRMEREDTRWRENLLEELSYAQVMLSSRRDDTYLDSAYTAIGDALEIVDPGND